MGPIVAKETGDTPEHAQRFNRAAGLRLAHVGGFPAELVEDAAHGLLRALVVAADEHRRLPPGNCGLTMKVWPTELNALRKRAAANSRWRRSISDSSRVVKNFRTPLLGGTSAMGFVASTTTLPARLSAFLQVWEEAQRAAAERPTVEELIEAALQGS